MNNSYSKVSGCKVKINPGVRYYTYLRLSPPRSLHLLPPGICDGLLGLDFPSQFKAIAYSWVSVTLIVSKSNKAQDRNHYTFPPATIYF